VAAKERSVLFHRSFHRFAGHHLKVWHYFNYVMEEPGYAPSMVMTKDSVWDETNPWHAVPELVIHEDRPHPADIYFFSGPLWRPVHRDQRPDAPAPVIHYMQSLRHAVADNLRYTLLENRAIRICVSEHVADSVRETGRARGPVLTIPAAIDVGGLQARFPPVERDTDLLIAALKQPEMGRRMASRLHAPNRTIRLLDDLIPHDEFLDAMRRAKVTLFLPAYDEGAPLPMLEGMALGTFVVCPDVIGNRAYCLDGQNCFRPNYDEDHILEAAAAAVSGYDGLSGMLANASELVRGYDLPTERAAFREVLRDVDRLWEEA
jgi:glycosyltransferase involved in cell wall biosynthesis